MTRVNERIRVPEIRVLYGEYNAIMPTSKALQKAKSLGLDLVEVAPHARPPVCRITDYGKWKYTQSKQKKDKKKTSGSKEKEVKFRVNIDPHDYGIKMTRAEDFLCHGFKVRFNLQFRGRQNAHKDLGFDLMNLVKVDLGGVAHVDLEPKLGGRNILMMMSPLPEKQQKRKFRADDHEDEIDIDAHDAAEAAESSDYEDDDDNDNDNDNDQDGGQEGDGDQEKAAESAGGEVPAESAEAAEADDSKSDNEDSVPSSEGE